MLIDEYFPLVPDQVDAAPSRVQSCGMPLDALGRGRNYIVGAARLLDFQGSMIDAAYFQLYRPFRGGSREETEVLRRDVRQLGSDFRHVLEREQQEPR